MDSITHSVNMNQAVVLKKAKGHMPDTKNTEVCKRRTSCMKIQSLENAEYYGPISSMQWFKKKKNPLKQQFLPLRPCESLEGDTVLEMFWSFAQWCWLLSLGYTLSNSSDFIIRFSSFYKKLSWLVPKWLENQGNAISIQCPPEICSRATHG